MSLNLRQEEGDEKEKEEKKGGWGKKQEKERKKKKKREKEDARLMTKCTLYDSSVQPSLHSTDADQHIHESVS